MQQNKVEIQCIDSWPAEEIVELYKAGGWWKDSYNPAGIPALISGSFAFAVAIDSITGKAIGMGRVLSDGVSDAYIQDLVVLPAYRKQDIGKKIVRALIDYCLSKGVTWIGLIAEPGTDQFYQDLGFQPMDKYIPLLYTKEP
jgi:GNAT superfamily N-acetyltransferase